VWMIVALRIGGGVGRAYDVPPTTTDDAIVAPPPVFSQPVETLQVVALRHKLARRTRQLAAARARVRGLRRTLAHSSSTVEAIGLACSVYGSCSTLWRRARCESKLNRYAQNASGASGLFQFLPSTFNSTPFAAFSIFSPYANALAAGWMMTHGRGGEWSCR